MLLYYFYHSRHSLKLSKTKSSSSLLWPTVATVTYPLHHKQEPYCRKGLPWNLYSSYISYYPNVLSRNFKHLITSLWVLSHPITSKAVTLSVIFYLQKWKWHGDANYILYLACLYIHSLYGSCGKLHWRYFRGGSLLKENGVLINIVCALIPRLSCVNSPVLSGIWGTGDSITFSFG